MSMRQDWNRLGQKQGQKALATLEEVHRWDFLTPVKEIQGDAHLLLGQYTLAANDYQAALATLPKASTWQPTALRLQQKQNNARLQKTDKHT